MDRRALVVVCLAFLGIVHGYTLRDILRERALRRFKEFDASEPYSELETRALNKLKEYHFRRLFDEESKVPACKDKNVDCEGVIAQYDEYIEKEGGTKFCEEPYTQDYVREYCRYTCNVDKCRDQIGNVKPPFPGAVVCRNLLSDACLSLRRRCGQYYVDKYCTRMCNPACQK